MSKYQLERIKDMYSGISDPDILDGIPVVTVAQSDIEWLINRVEELEEALEFYAGEETYEPLEVQIGAVTKEGYKISKYKHDPKINTDKGEKARQALEGEE